VTATPKIPRARILVADDDREHNETLAWRLTREGFDVETVLNGRACLDAIGQTDYDAVLLDIDFGEESGIDVLAAIRTSRTATELPVIMVTGSGDSEVTVTALHQGANDYITKPVDLAVTMARLRTQLAVRAATDQLRTRALYDPLTKLPNRALVADRFKHAVAHAARNGQHLAVFVLDLDGFKGINDHHGHLVGDKLLVAVARRLSACARKSDTVGRLGGDEFVVLAEGLHNTSDVDTITVRLIRAIERPYAIGGQKLHVGTSVGSHLWQFGDPESLERLLGLADAAMYQAKRARKSSSRDAQNDP
jgi:diguanylate cyclase (GGDEF)-like protein